MNSDIMQHIACYWKSDADENPQAPTGIQGSKIPNKILPVKVTAPVKIIFISIPCPFPSFTTIPVPISVVAVPIPVSFLLTITLSVPLPVFAPLPISVLVPASLRIPIPTSLPFPPLFPFSIPVSPFLPLLLSASGRFSVIIARSMLPKEHKKLTRESKPISSSLTGNDAYESKVKNTITVGTKYFTLGIKYLKSSQIQNTFFLKFIQHSKETREGTA